MTVGTKKIGAHRAPLEERLLDDFERGALAMTRCGAIEQCANSLDGLAVTANDPTHVALPKLELERGYFPAGNFREHHFIGKFNELPDDKFEKLSHQTRVTTNRRESTRIFWVVAAVYGRRTILPMRRATLRERRYRIAIVNPNFA